MIAQMLGISVDLTLPADAVTQTVAILAERGVGKTYTALALVEELLGAGARGIIADSAGVCWGLWAHATARARASHAGGAGSSPASTAW